MQFQKRIMSVVLMIAVMLFLTGCGINTIQYSTVNPRNDKVGVAMGSKVTISNKTTTSDKTVEASIQNSLETIIKDMKLPNDANPHGVPVSYSWSQGATVHHLDKVSPAILDQFHAMVAWGQAYVASIGSPAKNVRVEVRNIKAFALTKSDLKWHLIQSYPVVNGAAYREDFYKGINKPIDLRKEADGGVSAKLIKGYNFHFFAPQRAPFEPKNTLGIFTTFQARMVLDNPNLPDDRDQVRILADAGGDVWKSLSNNLPGKAEPDLGIGRFKYVRKEWQSFNMITLTEAQTRKYPPPIK